MVCERCGEESPRAWCPACERAYDTWVRRYASDIIVPLVAGSLVVMTVAMVLPLLGIDWLIGGAGAVVGFGTIGAMARINRYRRRKQFLCALPRASLLPAKT